MQADSPEKQAVSKKSLPDPRQANAKLLQLALLVHQANTRMLVISRRKGQRITIGEDVEIVITALHKSSVKLGINAPRGYAVLRGEVRDSIEAANREAANTSLDAAPQAGSPVTASRAFILRAKGVERQRPDNNQSQDDDGASLLSTTSEPLPSEACVPLPAAQAGSRAR